MTNKAKPRTKKLKSGAVYDLDKHRIVAHEGGNPTAFTHENAAEMARRRWQKHREAAARAVLGEVSAISGAKDVAAAWGYLNARLAQTILDSEKPRGDDLAILGRHIGAVPSEAELRRAEDAPRTGPSLTAPQIRAMIELADMLAARRMANAVEIVDAEKVISPRTGDLVDAD